VFAEAPHLLINGFWAIRGHKPLAARTPKKGFGKLQKVEYPDACTRRDPRTFAQPP